MITDTLNGSTIDDLGYTSRTVGLALLFPPSLGHIAASARAELLADWLGKRLDDTVDVQVAGDYAALERAIRDADVDLAWAPPAVCARTHECAAAIFKAVRGGRSEYRSALICRSQRVRDLEGLKGRRAAWVDELSVGGYLLAAGHLRAHGIDPDADLTAQRFYGSYATAVRAVLRGDCDFTSIYARSDGEADAVHSLEELIGDRARHLHVLAFTPSAPTDGLVITRRPGAEERLAAVERLCEELAGASRSHLLHVILDADTLVRANAGDYAALT